MPTRDSNLKNSKLTLVEMSVKNFLGYFFHQHLAVNFTIWNQPIRKELFWLFCLYASSKLSKNLKHTNRKVKITIFWLAESELWNSISASILISWNFRNKQFFQSFILFDSSTCQNQFLKFLHVFQTNTNTQWY